MSGKIPPSLIGTVDDEIHTMYLQIQEVRAFQLLWLAGFIWALKFFVKLWSKISSFRSVKLFSSHPWTQSIPSFVGEGCWGSGRSSETNGTADSANSRPGWSRSTGRLRNFLFHMVATKGSVIPNYLFPKIDRNELTFEVHVEIFFKIRDFVEIFTLERLFWFGG